MSQQEQDNVFEWLSKLEDHCQQASAASALQTKFSSSGLDASVAAALCSLKEPSKRIIDTKYAAFVDCPKKVVCWLQIRMETPTTSKCQILITQSIR